MSDTRYTLRWKATGDVEEGLTLGEMRDALRENECVLHEGRIYEKTDAEHTTPIGRVSLTNYRKD